ncbi:MAG: asparagine synthase B [Fimbriimonadales bacterium]|nr:MAG: asparagine synthase B [Fimbriimonadales bacterium]
MGIVCAFNSSSVAEITELVKELTGAEPNSSSLLEQGPVVLAGYAYKGGQAPVPVSAKRATQSIILDGTILNAQRIRESLKPKPRNSSPAATVLGLYAAKDRKVAHFLDGMFSLFLRDGDHFYAARDHLGSYPLYFAQMNGGWLFASELKAFVEKAQSLSEFPPGCYFHSDVGLRRYFRLEGPAKPVSFQDAIEVVRVLVTDAVKKHVGSGEVGILLNGSVESSILAALAYQKNRKVRTYSAGLEGSQDGHTAKKVAEWIGVKHTHVEVSVEDILNHLQEIVWSLETFDGPVVRHAVADYFAVRAAAEHVKVMVGSDAANELFGGYPYLRPMYQEKLTAEIKRITENLHRTHLLRWNRIVTGWGLEPRSPFTDRRLVHAVSKLPSNYKISEDGRAKWALRRAFSTMLPAWIVDRPDSEDVHCVGIQTALSEYADSVFTDEDLSKHKGKDAELQPSLRTKDELLYYQIWRQRFPEEFAALVGRTQF